MGEYWYHRVEQVKFVKIEKPQHPVKVENGVRYQRVK